MIVAMMIWGLGTQPGKEGGNPAIVWLTFLAIFLIMYLLIFRPQAKRQKQHRLMIESLNKGDKIITAGGIYGVVMGVKEKENILIVKIAENVKIELNRSSVAKKLE
ncbi:MAG: preprotein translocase subunit YajC [candidate division KSB1 bacterium]|nr:preprotein translocase subunit YajC [candidate division KSB1 bacterium]